MIKLRWKILPHEWAFGGFLLLTFLRVMWASPFSLTSMVFLALFVVGLALIEWAHERPTPLRWRIRLLWYPAAMGAAFAAIPMAVGEIGVPKADALLAPLDEKWLGMPAADYFLLVQSPLLTDIMVCGYVFFFIYLIVGPGYYCVVDLKRFRECFVGLFTIYAIGFFGYTVLPAGGPYQAVAFSEPLPEGPVAQYVLAIINRASNGVDVFPSIHGAVSLYLLLFDRQHYRARYELLLLPCLLLWLSTMYLRYHYAVDLIAALVLTGAGWLTVWLYRRSALARSVEQDAMVARLRG